MAPYVSPTLPPVLNPVGNFSATEFNTPPRRRIQPIAVPPVATTSALTFRQQKAKAANAFGLQLSRQPTQTQAKKYTEAELERISSR